MVVGGLGGVGGYGGGNYGSKSFVYISSYGSDVRKYASGGGGGGSGGNNVTSIKSGGYGADGICILTYWTRDDV